MPAMMLGNRISVVPSGTVRPAPAISSVSRAHDGGSRRYSMTCGSILAWRISAKVLREVLQAGLW
jgi:hypothetical protein